MSLALNDGDYQHQFVSIAVFWFRKSVDASALACCSHQDRIEACPRSKVLDWPLCVVARLLAFQVAASVGCFAFDSRISSSRLVTRRLEFAAVCG